MDRPSPTLEGFRVMLLHPAFGLAEVAWRWSFGVAASLLAGLFVGEYFDTLSLSRLDLLLLRSRQPVLVWRAVANIFRGSGMRFVQSFVVLAICLTFLWMLTASLGRTATVKALLEYFRARWRRDEADAGWRLGSLLGLNFFRAAAFLAAAVACLAPFAVMHALGRDSKEGGTVFITLVWILVYCAWSQVNWFLSLASLFLIRDGENTFGGVAAAIGLCREHPSSIFAVGIWFALAHGAAFVLGSFLALFSVGLLGALPAGVASASVVLVTLFYLAAANFLYMGRLAAYVALLELLEIPAVQTICPGMPQGGQAYKISPDTVDRDELILSDVPLVP